MLQNFTFFHPFLVFLFSLFSVTRLFLALCFWSHLTREEEEKEEREEEEEEEKEKKKRKRKKKEGRRGR